MYIVSKLYRMVDDSEEVIARCDSLKDALLATKSEYGITVQDCPMTLTESGGFEIYTTIKDLIISIEKESMAVIA